LVEAEAMATRANTKNDKQYEASQIWRDIYRLTRSVRCGGGVQPEVAGTA
jgi:hypothetical protein